MINVQTSYFDNIKEMILVEHTYSNGLVKDDYDKTKYTANSSIYYTFCIVLLVILSTFTVLNSTRWSLEKSVSKSAINKDCININNSFDNWSKPFYPNFRIIEFFFPKKYYMYCQTTCMKLFTFYGMTPLSSGTRVIYEQEQTRGYMRFSHASSRKNPYFSLVINFIENSNIHTLVDDIRKFIIDKKIHMTYHTTYKFPFSSADIQYMFPEVGDFIEMKQMYDPYSLFTNQFNEAYLQ